MTTPITEPERPRGRQAWNELAGPDDWPRFILVNQIMRYLTQHDAGQYNFETGQSVVLANRPDRSSRAATCCSRPTARRSRCRRATTS